MSDGGTIYAIAIEGSHLVKIGCTRRPVEKRLRMLQMSQPFPLVLVASLLVTENLWHTEQKIHAMLEEYLVRGEWFRIALDVPIFTALVQESGVKLLSASLEVSQMPSLGQQIKIARARKGWQQQQLAAEAHLSQKYLSQIEHDHVDPRWSIVQRLACALEVSLDSLGREVQPAP